MFLIVFLTSLFRAPKLDEYEMEQDAEEEEEEGLLASTGRRFGATWQDLTGRVGGTKKTGSAGRGNRQEGDDEED